MPPRLAHHLPVRGFRLAMVAAVLGLGPTVHAAGAQVRAALVNGALTGTVTDTTAGTPVGLALVTAVRAGRRVFANDRGGFVLAGLKPGAERIRVQQIGYFPREIEVVLEDVPAGPVSPLVIGLGGRVQVLPELVVAGVDVRPYRQPRQCVAPAQAIQGPSAQFVIDQAVTTADRIVALEQADRTTVTYEHVREARDADDRVLARWVDTIAADPARRRPYRRGQVAQEKRWLRPGVGSPVADVQYFAMSDLARDEFQAAHCAWYMGLDSADAGRTHRIAFEPAPGVKTVDWAGLLQFDATTFELVRSDAWLVGGKGREPVSRARCAVRYGAEVATMVHERAAICLTDLSGDEVRSSRDVYRVIGTRRGAKPDS